MSAFLRAFAAVALLQFAAPALADNYPSKPIRLVVPYPPGGSTDILARAVQPKLNAAFGQTVIVDNRAGAGGILGSAEVSRAAPDGYTLLVGTSSTHVIVKYLSKNLSYDPLKDFTPITAAVEIPIVVVVPPSFAPSTGKELVEYAKKNPGKLSFGSSGPGSVHHLAGEALNQFAGIDMLHVPYKGAAPAVQDVVGGQIPVVFTTLATALPFIQNKRLKALGVTEAKRSASAPEIPTIGESVPGYSMPASWIGIFGPAGMPAPLVKRISAEFVKAVQAPDVKSRLDGGGLPATGTSAEEFAAMLKSDHAAIHRIVTQAKIQPE